MQILRETIQIMNCSVSSIWLLSTCSKLEILRGLEINWFNSGCFLLHCWSITYSPILCNVSNERKIFLSGGRPGFPIQYITTGKIITVVTVFIDMYFCGFRMVLNFPLQKLMKFTRWSYWSLKEICNLTFGY